MTKFKMFREKYFILWKLYSKIQQQRNRKFYVTCRGPNVLSFTITGDKFVIYILIRTTEAIPRENDLLHPIIR
jgi:hypothetical protein